MTKSNIMPRSTIEEYRYPKYLDDEEEQNHDIEYYEEVDRSMRCRRSPAQSEQTYPESYEYSDVPSEYRNQRRNTCADKSDLNSSKEPCTLERRSSQWKMTRSRRQGVGVCVRGH